jgi:hypothetical protein
MTDKTSLLHEIGKTLYGMRWQAALARDPYVSASERTMRRWASGEDAMPDGAWLDLARLLETRAINLRRFRKRISDAFPHLQISA